MILATPTKTGGMSMNLNSPTLEENQSLINEAVEIAKTADLVVLALGENLFLGREAWGDNHRGDRPTFDLTESQQVLANAVLATGKPVVLYLMNGRPVSLGDLGEKIPAILTGHYNGQQTGNAAADVLFGKINPSGKLTVSWPRSVGHQPAHYNQHSSGNVFDYVDSPLQAVYPFGHGLSYTTFEYGSPRLSQTTIRPGESVQVSVDVANRGVRSGDEIVQVYVDWRVIPNRTTSAGTERVCENQSEAGRNQNSQRQNFS